jgi:hypothetical protein
MRLALNKPTLNNNNHLMHQANTLARVEGTNRNTTDFLVKGADIGSREYVSNFEQD